MQYSYIFIHYSTTTTIVYTTARLDGPTRCHKVTSPVMYLILLQQLLLLVHVEVLYIN